MTYRANPRDFAPLPNAFRSTLTQVDVASAFAERNDDLENTAYFFAYCRTSRTWHVAESSAGDWTHPRWSYAEDYDPLPRLYAKIIKIIRSLTETASPAELRRCLSHAFVSGVIKLLQVDERTICEPWEIRGCHPPKPLREELKAQRDAEMRAIMQEEQRRALR